MGNMHGIEFSGNDAETGFLHVLVLGRSPMNDGRRNSRRLHVEAGGSVTINEFIHVKNAVRPTWYIHELY